MGLWNNNLRAIVAHLAAATLCVSAEAKAGSDSSSSSYGLQLEGGGSSVRSAKDYEIRKSGPNLGAMIFVNTHANCGIWGLGLGVQHTSVAGDVSDRGIKQELQLDLLYLDLRYLYAFNESFSAGPSLRGYSGKGADYGVVNTDDTKFLLTPGLILRYEWTQIEYAPALSIAVYQDANVTERKIQNFMIAASLSLGIESSANTTLDSEAKPLPETPMAKPVAPPEPGAEEAKTGDVLVLRPPTEDLSPVAEVKAEYPKLERLTFTFAPKSSLLSRESKMQIKKLAKVLVLHADAWTKISVSGHSDKSGDPERNKALSQKRAEALCKRLTTRGVPGKKLSCIGEGSDRLLSGVAENAPEQRRIELKFEEYDVSKIDSFKTDVDKALQK